MFQFSNTLLERSLLIGTSVGWRPRDLGTMPLHKLKERTRTTRTKFQRAYLPVMNYKVGGYLRYCTYIYQGTTYLKS